MVWRMRGRLRCVLALPRMYCLLMPHIVSVHIRWCGGMIVFLAGSVAMQMSNDSAKGDARVATTT